jgi:hypothetical protein
MRWPVPFLIAAVSGVGLLGALLALVRLAHAATFVVLPPTLAPVPPGHRGWGRCRRCR